jgi:membrane associated rhomboid family serine protease
MTDEARLRLAESRRLLDAGDVDHAMELLTELARSPDREIAGEAWLLMGTARYRTDDEAGALQAWQASADAGGANAWLGSRRVAEQLVREGKLEDAIAAYREADRHAPPEERGAIANRIAWLLKETGHDFGARRQFNRARGAYGTYPAYVTWGLIAICVGVYVIDTALARGTDGGPLTQAWILYQPAVAQGEWWRLITHAFLHAPLAGGGLGILHILFNMYALYLFGPVIEELYGHFEYLIIYLLCALGGGVLTVLAAPGTPVLGASGAIFGLFGVGFTVWRRQHLVLNPRSRMILSQMGPLLVINLVFTFAVRGISWTGHIGGLLVGAAIGLLVVPSGGTTLAGMWSGPVAPTASQPSVIGAALLRRAAVYAGILAILVAAAAWSVNVTPVGFVR